MTPAVRPAGPWLRAPLLRATAALAVFVAATAIVTWPAMARPGDRIFGYPGDATGMIALLRYRIDAGAGPLSTAVTTQESFPQGIALPGATALPQLAMEGPMQAIAWAGGDAALAYGLWVLLGLLLTPLAAYLLVERVTGSWGAGVVAGVAYGFNPWHLEKAQGHVHLVHVESLPLLVLGLLLVRDGQGRLGWPITLGSLALAAYTHTYFALFVGAIVAGFVLADVGLGLADSRSAAMSALRRAGSFALATVAVYLPQGVWLLFQRDAIDDQIALTRVSDGYRSFGARAWEYLVPSERSPINDWWSADIRLSHLHGSNLSETNIYVGAIVLALAIGGLVVAVVGRRRDHRSFEVAMIALAIAAVGLVLSLGNLAVAGASVPPPAAAIAQGFDDWRVYARLFAVVQLGVVIMLGLAVAQIERRAPRRAAAALVAALAVAVFVDLYAPPRTFSAEPDAIYSVTGAQPEAGARVEYPVVPPANGLHLTYIWGTEAAGRPLLNGGKPETWEASLQGRLADPTKPWVGPVLAAMGVRYAIVHGLHFRGRIDGPGREEIARRNTDILYRVEAEAAQLLAVPGDGFDVPEPEGEGFEQWLRRSEGTIAIWNDTPRASPVTLRFRLGSFFLPRIVTIEDENGVVLRRTVGTEPQPFELTTTAEPGVTELRISTDEPPTRISDVLTIGDVREVSLRMSGIDVEAPSARALSVG